jgi:hypothetical protein
MKQEPETSRDLAAASPKWPETEVHYLILKTDEFIVFLDSDLDVDWQTSAKYDEAGPQDPGEHNAILNRVAALECIPNDHHKTSIRQNFKRMLGEGVARSLDHDYDGAKKILDQAQAYIADRNVETARYWQLSTACALGVAVGLLGIGLWAFRAFLTHAWSELPYFIVMAGVAGSLGAVLSMIFRMGHSFPTSEAPKTLHILEAASRVFAGCLSGALIAAAVAVGLILPVFKETGQAHIAMLIAGMASGASERWAPSLIGRLESSSDERRSKKGPKP